ncbi:MAG: hypothetical protein IJJ26_07590 [Victivallales bacterium]|nr:hypothetical protein [Victivallales bacterium]
MSEKHWLSEFENPSALYRGLPFWSWSGRLEESSLRAQVRDFQAMGLGGFFMHARAGLETPYLGKEWFQAIHASIDEAEKQGLQACLYDDDRWPSGPAGGLVTSNPAYRAQVLYVRPWTDFAKFNPNENRLGLWAGRLTNTTITGLREIHDVAERRHGETVFDAIVETLPGEPRYNGYTNIDVLNPEAVQKFLEITYERYWKECGDKFGNTVPSIFTDEPQYTRYCMENYFRVRYPGAHVCAWTGELPRLFHEHAGFDLAPRALELFYNIPGHDCAATRYFYFQTLSERFVASYTIPIASWCGAHGIDFTGHLLWEDTPLLQSRAIGVAMRHYPHMQVPGMDQLGECTKLYDACKQVASVARQFGRKYRISEVYGCTGWDTAFAAYKAMADWQFLLGINRRCLHLSFCTLKGDAKRDYPASFTRHSNFFPIMHSLEDYFARLGCALSQGEELRDILVVHPIESVWVKVDCSLKDAEMVDRRLAALRDCLLAEALDFDYGDEVLMQQVGSVETDSEGRPVLRVGLATYHAVLLPEMETIRSTTLALLEKFRAAGGLLVCMGTAPERVDGVPSDAAKPLFSALPQGIAPLEAVRQVRYCTGEGAFALLHQLRRTKDGLLLAVCNTGFVAPVGDSHNDRVYRRTRRFQALGLDVLCKQPGTWVELVPETGERFLANASQTEQGWHLTADFAPLQTRLFLLVADAAGALPRPAAFHATHEQRLPLPAKISLNMPNTLVLDFARMDMDDLPAGGRRFILDQDDMVRKHINIPGGGAARFQPWAFHSTSTRKTTLAVHYDFRLQEVPSRLQVALEEPLRWQIELNGTPVPQNDDGCWLDEAFRLRTLPSPALRKGLNTITLRGEADVYSASLEAMYLLGDFEVQNETICPRTTTALEAGDWCLQGLPNYAGDVTYRFPFKYNGGRVKLRLDSVKATAVRVLVNGEEQAVLCWPPLEAELSNLRPGENLLELQLIGSRRNALGPFFMANPEMPRYGNAEFRASLHPEYRFLAPYGLFAEPVLLFE